MTRRDDDDTDGADPSLLLRWKTGLPAKSDDWKTRPENSYGEQLKRLRERASVSSSRDLAGDLELGEDLHERMRQNRKLQDNGEKTERLDTKVREWSDGWRKHYPYSRDNSTRKMAEALAGLAWFVELAELDAEKPEDAKIESARNVLRRLKIT